MSESTARFSAPVTRSDRPVLPRAVDAVVIGAGPNGLVAANLLADAGWQVVVLEAQADPGGAVRTAELTLPGFHHDVFSAFYPFGAASPIIAGLGLGDYGLRWTRAPIVLGHPTLDGPSALLSMDRAETGASLDAFASGDGARWREVMSTWDRIGGPFLEVMLAPFPPVRSAARLAARLGPRGARSFARDALLPVRRLADERFEGVGAGLLLAGLALHTDLAPEATASGLFGWLLAGLAEQVGFPVPVGGAQRLVDALVARLAARGGEVICGARVDRVLVRDGAATGVAVGGQSVLARHAVVADVGAPALYAGLVGLDLLPARMRVELARFEPGAGTVKVDWALSGPIPWRDEQLSRAGTVHLTNSMNELSEYSFHLATQQLPAKPFLLIGQMTTTDPTRSPQGTETAWAYTHVPQQVREDAAGELEPGWTPASAEAFADRMEARIEAHAPGFRDRILARHLLTPPDFERLDANLVGGEIGGGTAQLHQQLIFRPVAGLARAETPIDRLYLASASAHPGGGVHGAPGSNAARAALLREGFAGPALALAKRLISATDRPWAVPTR